MKQMFNNAYTILKSKEVKQFLRELKKQFGFSGNIPYTLLTKKNKIYAISKEYLSLPIENFNINSVGLYIAKKEKNGIRLSIDGSQLIGPQSTKNILELDSPQEWLQGHDIENRNKLRHYILTKHKDDFLGCGYCKKDKILNYIPKSRRLK